MQSSSLKQGTRVSLQRRPVGTANGPFMVIDNLTHQLVQCFLSSRMLIRRIETNQNTQATTPVPDSKRSAPPSTQIHAPAVPDLPVGSGQSCVGSRSCPSCQPCFAEQRTAGTYAGNTFLTGGLGLVAQWASGRLQELVERR